jgi:subtilisin family serine protease
MRKPILNQHTLPLLLAAALLLVALPLLSAFATQTTDEAPQIRLQYASFDPLKAEPPLPDTLQMQVAPGQPAMMLVQFSGPVQQEWKDAVQAAGAPLYDYIPDHAFLTHIDGDTAQALRSLPFVRWVGAYQPAYRLPASLSETAANAVETGQAPLDLEVATLPDADLASLVAQVQALGGSLQSQSSGDLAGYLRLSLPAAQVYSLAALDGVVWVQTYQPRQLLNDIGEGIMSIPAVRSSLGLYGGNQVVAIADSGLDVGTTGAAMSDDFEGRIASGSSLCGPFTGRTAWNDFGGHGTHVSGSVLGNGALSSGLFAGAAPQARLVFQAVDDPSTDYLECIPETLYADMFQPAYNLNARIHSDSWGGPSGDPPNPYGGYDLQAREVDWAAWNLKNLLILYAAGNSGTDANYDGLVDSDSILSPGTAKNPVTVGATENNRPSLDYSWGAYFSFLAEPIYSDLLADDSTGMAAFSSRGPTDDGRVKPDIVAPGTFILSTRSHDPAAGIGWLAYDENYTYNGGTSMATPLTAGSAALLREWLTKSRGFSNPSAALMKAALLNGTVDISPGQYTSPQEIPAQRPNNVSGWGRADLKASLNPAAPRQVWLQDNTSGLATGGKATYSLKVGGALAQAEDYPVSLDISPAEEAFPAAESTPQPPKMSSRVGQRVELTLDSQPASPSNVNPPDAPAADVSMVLDDGDLEMLYGVSDLDTGNAVQFLWLNRFTPPAAQFPFTLEQIRVLFDDNGGTANVHVDDAIDLLVYYDNDTDPSNGASLERVVFDETIQAVDGATWSVYDLVSSVTFNTPGDVLIGVINRYVDDSVTPMSYPATYDNSSPQGRSWRGWWFSTPPDMPGLPPDDFFEVKTDANWMIRGYGTTTSVVPTATPSPTPSPSPTAGPSPTPTPPPVSGGPLRLTLAWTDYPGAVAAGKALVNDLDLEVVAPDGTHYYGNAGLYTSGQCLREAKWDSCNNVEGVYIPSAKYGTYTVYVHGYTVPNGPQPFALVASGDNLLTSGLNKRIFLPMVRKQ